MSEKHPGGRPPIYETKEEMQAIIDAYFEECKGVPFVGDDGEIWRTDKGYIVYKIPPKPPTVTGLALALGLASRQALLNYQNRDEFNDTVTRAKLRIEEYAETRLFDRDGVNGAKFSLMNNFKGWRDKPREDEEESGVTIVDDY